MALGVQGRKGMGGDGGEERDEKEREGSWCVVGESKRCQRPAGKGRGGVGPSILAQLY